MAEKHSRKKRPFFKTVYWRLLMAYIVIITIAVAVLTGVMISIITIQYQDNTKADMFRECDHINSIMSGWWDGEQRDAVSLELGTIARQYNAQIWIIGLDKEVTIQPGDNWFISEEKIKDADYVDAVLQGNKVSIPELYDNPDIPVMTVGRPIVIDGRIEGAILMSKQLMDIRKSTQSITQSILLPSCLAILLTVVLVSLILLRVTHPLVEMNRIAKSYAKGDFKERVKVTSGDEIGQLAESFNAMATDLENLETMRRSFVANVSHELKSPLASMWGFLQAMLDGSIPEEEHPEYMQLVLEETQRLNALINDLLNLSTIESGKIPLKSSKFDLNELILRTLFTFEQRIDEKELEVDIQFETDQLYVWADSERVTQVIRNLVDNALKYLELHGVLTIKTEVDKKEKMVTVFVKDTGAGIPEEDVKHVWERFYKVDKAHTPRKEGTGLGLSITKRIIEQHGGSVGVESVLTEGTTFWFSLPLFENQEEEQLKKQLKKK